MYAIPKQRQELLAELRNAGDAQGSEGGAVIGPISSEDLVARFLTTCHVIVACELDRRLNRFRASAHEEHLVETLWSSFGNQRCSLDGGRTRETPVGEEPELFHLLHGSGGQVIATMAKVGTEKSRQPVEVFIAVRVLDVAACAAFHDRKVAAPPSTFGVVRDEVRLRDFAFIHLCLPSKHSRC